jgi:branched-chain amino acid transport system ATP-binding protein
LEQPDIPAASTGSAVATRAAGPEAPVLQTENLGGGYGRKQVVFDVNLHVGSGEIVSIIGHNGGGKTTTLKTIFGMLPAMSGSITYRGADVTKASCRHNVKAGMSIIPAERFVFGDLTVEDNLRLGAGHEPSMDIRRQRLERVQEIFPILAKRSGQRAGTMSGGEQRMLSLGLALMGGPKLLLLDEPSLGLAPALVTDIFARVRSLADTDGLAVLLLEQNVGQVVRIADRVYAMRSGRIFLEETADQMKSRSQYWDLF